MSFQRMMIFVGALVAMVMSLGAENVMFNYQGRIAVDDVAFNGAGEFKFALVNDAGTVTLWSNDGTSVAGAEPTGSIASFVNDGVFSVMVGDPSIGMAPVDSLLFNMGGGHNLRVWFDDGLTGFQQLAPDRRVVNPSLIGVLGEDTAITLYVDATTGSDDYPGLDPARPKATIQGAVDMLPRELQSTVTISVSPGVYREAVEIFGFTRMNGVASLTIIGDATWTPGSLSDPAVRLTGSDDDATPVRERGFWLNDSETITLQGFLLDDFSHAGVLSANSGVVIKNCLATDNLNGYISTLSSRCTLADSTATLNTGMGLAVSNISTVSLSNFHSDDNGTFGTMINSRCSVSVNDGGSFSDNGDSGIHVTHNSFILFRDTLTVDDNGGYGLDVRYQSYAESPSFLTLSGNTSGATNLLHDGAFYN